MSHIDSTHPITGKFSSPSGSNLTKFHTANLNTSEMFIWHQYASHTPTPSPIQVNKLGKVALEDKKYVKKPKIQRASRLIKKRAFGLDCVLSFFFHVSR